MGLKILSKFLSADLIYKHLLGPFLAQDQGIDAEQLTQIAGY